MRRVLLLLCALALSLPGARLLAQDDGGKGKGSSDELLRQSVDANGSYPGGPGGITGPKAPLATGYYVVDNDGPTIGPYWTPNYTIVDTTGAEAVYWRRILSGPNQRPMSTWTQFGSEGYEFFRNPTTNTPGPNNTIITDSTDDAIAGPISIGFPFFYYGRKYDSFYVSTNGLIALTNRRYQYDERGNRIDYEPIHDGFASFPPTGNALTDPVHDDYGYTRVALGDTNAPQAGIRNPVNSVFPNTQLRSVIAPLWDDLELSQYDKTLQRPDDFGKVYWRRDLAGEKLIIYFVNLSMANTKAPQYGGGAVLKGIPPLPGYSQVAARAISASFQVVLDRNDSTIQFNYRRFTGVYQDPVSQVINVPAAQMFRANSTIGVQSHDQEYTNYLFNGEAPGGPEGLGAVYVNGSANSTPHQNMAIRFKQWRNVVRVVSVKFQVPSIYTPGTFVDAPAGLDANNFELLLGSPILGVIRPVGIVQNVSDSIGPVNKIPQPIRFNVVFRIRDLVNTNNPPVYQRTATTDTLSPLRIAGKKNRDTILFEPYVTASGYNRELGRFRAEIITTDFNPNGISYGQEWPFDDTTGVRVFGIRRIDGGFVENFGSFSVSQEEGVLPSVENWVAIGPQVVDGDKETFNPPPPRGTFQVGTTILNSPVCVLDRRDNFGNVYNGDGRLAPDTLRFGDTLLSFPINLSQFVQRPVLIFSYERAGKPGNAAATYDRGFSDNQRIGPEHSVYNTQKSGFLQVPDALVVDFAEPSPDGIDRVTNIYGKSNWIDPTFADTRTATNAPIKWKHIDAQQYDPAWNSSAPVEPPNASGILSSYSPRWGVFGGGGGTGLDTLGHIVVDEFDAGKDFEFYRAYIPIPARWSKVNPGFKTFRFRIRLLAKTDKNPSGTPADDEDRFYIDNVMVVEPVKPEVEITTVKVDWPYTQAPASQARAIPVSVKVANNGATTATIFGVAMYIQDVNNPAPAGLYRYYRYRSIIALQGGRDYTESFPTWNAQECGANIPVNPTNEFQTTKTDYRVYARILPENYDSHGENDSTYTDFSLTLGPAYAYDDGTNDVFSFANLPGKGLNLIPNTNGVPLVQDGAMDQPFGPIGGVSSGTFAMQFRIYQTDTIHGFQAYYSGANQSPDYVRYAIHQQNPGTNANNPPAQPVASTIRYARRGEGTPVTPPLIPGQPYNFDMYVTYMLDTPYVVTPGLYFVSVAQLGETGLELGGDASRMAQVTTVGSPGPPQGVGNVSPAVHPEMRQNRFWWEVTTGSQNWNPMITSSNNPGYPNLTWDGQNPPAVGIPTFTRGSWIPMVRPYFGPRASTECTVEPVELADFKLTQLQSALRLDWETATEINNHGFYVERRVRGGSWSDIGFRQGAGTSNQTRQYDYVDNNVAVNTTYQYRLRQEDRDGAVNYSGIKEGRINSATSGMTNELAQNTPNPVSSGTRIAFSVVNSEKVRLDINDVYGNVVRSFEVDAKAGEQNEVVWNGLDANGVKVPNGAYIYKLVGNGFTLSRKLTVTR